MPLLYDFARPDAPERGLVCVYHTENHTFFQGNTDKNKQLRAIKNKTRQCYSLHKKEVQTRAKKQG